MCFKRMDDVHETLVTGVGLGAALRGRILREMPVIVVQATELQSGTGNRARQLQDRIRVIIRNAGAIHPGIYIHEDTYRTAGPLRKLRLILNQNRNSYLAVLLSDLAHACRISSDQRIRDENIMRAGLACDAEFQAGGALELPDA